MKKLLIFSLFALGCTLQKEPNQRTINYEGEEILIGRVTPAGFQEEPFLEWYTYFYEDYVIDTLVLNMIRDELVASEITIFLGTWCDDSQWQVPGFIKMLEYVGYDVDRLTLIALQRDEDKVMFSPEGEEKGLNITHVPTYIFYQSGKELGRIVENPMQSLEKDTQELLERE